MIAGQDGLGAEGAWRQFFLRGSILVWDGVELRVTILR